MKRVVVIGGGAAGLMAAVIAGREGAKVTLLEKMNYVGKKMGITGKGRCNITNACDMSDFIKNTPGNGKFYMVLTSALPMKICCSYYMTLV